MVAAVARRTADTWEVEQARAPADGGPVGAREVQPGGEPFGRGEADGHSVNFSGEVVMAAHRGERPDTARGNYFCFLSAFFLLIY